ncbi:hypothetical protein AV530_014728 [Patagioenas fasciata monilis]|uniref:Uncharacterized protein n=1 Tax=Patagioenas fasciata monilis TaxID=372326 RepID=A0A1V4KRC9_PATFA|nr:hypothetical protein AV530_014728 [Patagioenas fasciata monilis]
MRTGRSWRRGRLGGRGCARLRERSRWRVRRSRLRGAERTGRVRPGGPAAPGEAPGQRAGPAGVLGPRYRPPTCPYSGCAASGREMKI